MNDIKILTQTILPLLVACLCFSTSSKAQSAYHGGKGDGYASAEIQNVILNINAEISRTQSVNLYPNPAKTSQNLQIVMPQPGQYKMEIVNLLGQPVFIETFNSGNANIPLSGCQPGSYIVDIRCGNFNYIQKLVVIAP